MTEFEEKLNEIRSCVEYIETDFNDIENNINQMLDADNWKSPMQNKICEINKDRVLYVKNIIEQYSAMLEYLDIVLHNSKIL